jgi:hypothetical protein
MSITRLNLKFEVRKMKLRNSVLISVAALISVSAFAANTRKPAGVSCGDKASAIRAAFRQAQEDHGTCDSKPLSDGIDGPIGGQFFTTYRISFKCGGNQVEYDAETHFVGMPGKMACTATVSAASGVAQPE